VRSFIAGIRRLVLPWGAITGARLVLDGTTGSIQVFNAANELIVSLDANGVEALGTAASGSYVLMNNAGAQAQFSLNPAVQVGHTQIPATMEAFFFAPGTNPALEIDSPTVDGGAASTITMIGAAGGNGARIDFVCDAFTLNDLLGSRVARMLTFCQAKTATAGLALTGVPTLVPGCSIAVTPTRPTSLWTCDIVTDSQLAAAGDLTVGQVFINGVAQPQQAIHVGPAAARATVAQHYAGTFAGIAAQTFELRGNKAGGASVYNATHTSIRVSLYE
jgi:hypothetical protein